MLRVLSLGAGVQSSTLALLAARGEIGPMPDCAIFADTGRERRSTYQWLDWLETQLPFPVHRARRKGDDLGQHAISIAHNDVTRTASPPWFVKEGGYISMLPRQCSKEFKVRVIQQKVRELLGLAPGQRGPRSVAVTQWIGISLDEAQRMKSSELAYVENVFPLYERRMTRLHCIDWMHANGYPRPPKSSCYFCPYQGDEQWRDLRDNHPADWEQAVEFDRSIRPGFFGMTGNAFVHKQCVPLDQVDLRNAGDFGQTEMFDNECEGMCGV